MSAFLAPATISGRAYLAPAVMFAVVVPAVTGVTVSPSAAAIAGGAQLQFAAVVAGSNSPVQTVTWSATGAGTISAGGLFTASASTLLAQAATITATSTLDGTVSGSAAVVVLATPIVAPVEARVFDHLPAPRARRMTL